MGIERRASYAALSIAAEIGKADRDLVATFIDNFSAGVSISCRGSTNVTIPRLQVKLSRRFKPLIGFRRAMFLRVRRIVRARIQASRIGQIQRIVPNISGSLQQGRAR